MQLAMIRLCPVNMTTILINVLLLMEVHVHQVHQTRMILIQVVSTLQAGQTQFQMITTAPSIDNLGALEVL